MRLNRLHIQNFGSIRDLTVDFHNQGITTIEGPTGSGKSSIFNALTWTLFGKTPKNTSAKGIMSWAAQEPTKCELTIEVDGKTHLITRVRSERSTENDITITSDDRIIRGKDATDTQRAINELVKSDFDTFNITTYFSSASLSSQFFSATSEQRRGLLSSISNLEYPQKVIDKVQEALKKDKNTLKETDTRLSILKSQASKVNHLLIASLEDMKRFEEERRRNIKKLLEDILNSDNIKKDKLALLKTKSNWFDDTRNRAIKKYDEDILKLSEWLSENEVKKCNTCGRVDEDTDKAIEKIAFLKSKINDLVSQVNPHEVSMSSIVENVVDNLIENKKIEEKRVNPFSATVDRLRKDEDQVLVQLETIEKDKKDLVARINGLSIITAAAVKAKSEITEASLKRLEGDINECLNSCFDSPFSVSLNSDKDSIDFTIYSNGNECSFDQLSKGQQAVLRLSFGIACQRAASFRFGTDSSAVFIDEALDGMDSQFRVKAVFALQKMFPADTSIYLVDHSPEVKALSDHKILVSIQNGVSEYAVD